MKPHTRALVFAFLRQMRGALAAVELFLAEDDKMNQPPPKEADNQEGSRTLRLRKNG